MNSLEKRGDGLIVRKPALANSLLNLALYSIYPVWA